MGSFGAGLVLGLFPEVLYFTLFLNFAKDLKEKRLLLFVLLAIGYLLLIMICRYELLFYLAYIVYSFFVMKVLYKAHISDVFVFIFAFLYLIIVAFISHALLFKYYLPCYILDRILLFVPLIIFRNKIKELYKKFRYLWNKHSEKVKIKSITIRNVSLLLMNILIILLAIFVIMAFKDYLRL